jgi:NitT/TauT family transport system substrate-binding protein
MTGTMSGFLVGGWGTLQSYAQKYPRTVAAFQRAMARAQRLAATDRSLVRQTLPTYTSIKPKLAAAMTLGAYSATLSAATLQHAADVMLQFGFLRHRLTVAPMVLPEP